MSTHLTHGQRAKHWREIRGLTQVELATRLKWDKSKLCRIESGEQEPRASEIEAIAEELELTMPEFYGEAS